jgi:hypothetical protein
MISGFGTAVMLGWINEMSLARMLPYWVCVRKLRIIKYTALVQDG